MSYSVEYILLLIKGIREYIFLQKTWEIRDGKKPAAICYGQSDTDSDDIVGHKIYINVDIQDGPGNPLSEHNGLDNKSYSNRKPGRIILHRLLLLLVQLLPLEQLLR